MDFYDPQMLEESKEDRFVLMEEHHTNLDGVA